MDRNQTEAFMINEINQNIEIDHLRNIENFDNGR